MNCCNQKTAVKDSRLVAGLVKRRRVCKVCHRSFFTLEKELGRLQDKMIKMRNKLMKQV